MAGWYGSTVSSDGHRRRRGPFRPVYLLSTFISIHQYPEQAGSYESLRRSTARSEGASAGTVTEPAEIQNELLRARREVDRRDDGVVVTHRVDSRSRMPVKFQLYDPLPGRLTANAVGFHPDHEPAHGRLDREMAVISGVVNPHRQHVTKYAVQVDAMPSPEELGRLQEEVRPSIEISAIIGPEDEEDEVESELEQAATTRSSSKQAAEPSGPSAFESSELGQLWAKEGAIEAEIVSEAPDAANTTVEASAADEPAEQAAEDTPEREPDDRPRHGLGGDPFGSTAANGKLAAGISGASSEAEARADSSPEPTRAGDDDDYPSLAEVLQGASVDAPEDEAAPDVEDDAPVTEPASDKDIDVAEQLLEQLEAGRVSPEQRQRLSEHLGEALDVEPPKSLESRIQAIESELSAFGAYVDALDGIIDEHGSPEAFLAEIRQEVSSLKETMESIEQELDEAATERTRTSEQLDALDETLERLTARTERLRDRVKSLREAHRERVADIEARLEELEPVSDRVEELRTELETVSEAVEAAEARRQAVLEALTADDPVED